MAVNDVVYKTVPKNEIVEECPLPPTAPKGLGVRHLQALLLFISLAIGLAVRSQLSVLMVAMINQDDKDCNNTQMENATNNSDENCHRNQNMGGVYRTYDWNKSTQEIIVFSFFVGYTSMQLPMGLIAQKIGGKIPLMVALSANGLLSICTPWVSMFGGWIGVSVTRFLQGVTQAAFYPSIHTMLAKWSPLKSILGIRHLQVVMLFFAMLLAFCMRVNMSMAIVAMTDKDSENAFDWSMQTQSVILSSFFWGYIILQIPAGEIAARYGGSLLITIVIVGNSAISLLIPLASYYGGWQTLCACRVLQGLAQGFLYPSTHNLIGKWVPLEEKSRLGTAIYAGAQLGTALQLLAAGFIADSWGWPGIFYVNGALGAIWTVIYVIFGADSPQTSKMISSQEKLYIQTSLGQVGERKKLITPWKSIWTSLPFITLIITHCGQNWGFWTLMTEIPSYMKQILGVDIKANGVMSALPYLTMYLLGFPFGFISDYVLKKKWASISTCRKVSNSIGIWGPAIFLIGLSYVPAGDIALAVTLLTVAVSLNAGHYTGFLIVHIDMAPNFAGTLMGITNCFANIISIIAPLVAGLFIKDVSDPEQWRQVFYLCSAIYFASNLFFIIFGSSETQPWNTPKEVDDSNNVKEKSANIEKHV